MSMKIVFLLALAVSAYALPSTEDSVVPEETVLVETAPAIANIQEMARVHEEAEAYLKQNGQNACKSLADATEKEVTDNVAAEQAILNKIDTGANCPNEGQASVKAAEQDLKNAEDDKKKADKALDDAQNADVDFGKRKYNGLSKGNCNTFFNSQAFQEAEQKVNAAKNAATSAAGKVTQAKNAVASAKAAAKKDMKKCQCNAYKQHEAALKASNKKVADANTKAWTKAAHLECVLAGKTTNQCSVPALPKVNAVTMAAGVDSKACGDWKAEWCTNTKTGGSQNHKKFCLYRMAATTGFSDDSNGSAHYQNICNAAGLKGVGCGTSSYNAAPYSNSIAMPSNWGCNMMGPLAQHTGWSSVVAYQEIPGAGAHLYTDKHGHPHSGMALNPVCGQHQ